MKSFEQREVPVDADRQEHFRLRSERVIAKYLHDHPDSRLRERVQDRSLTSDDASEIMREANVDAKTGIPNAKFLSYILEDEMMQSREEKQPVSVIVFDIDDFKQINTELGHAEADKILREVAQTIQRSIRTSDEITPHQAQDEALSRWGGEEFVVVLPNTSTAQAHEVADRIRARVEETLAEVRPDGRLVTVTAGVAEYDRTKHGDAADDERRAEDEPKSWQRFVDEADQAMLAGKQVRKNTVYPAAEAA